MLYKLYIIKEEDIPDSYYQHEAQIARERGRGNIELTAEEVLISDVERLIVPLIRNYALALDTKLKAEKLDIYLSHIINKESMLKDGVHYSELLPNEDLQDYFETSYDKTQFIALTQNQKHAIEEQILENFSHYLMEDIDN